MKDKILFSTIFFMLFVSGCSFKIFVSKYKVKYIETGFIVFIPNSAKRVAINKIYFAPSKIKDTENFIENFKSKNLVGSFVINKYCNEGDISYIEEKAKEFKIKFGEGYESIYILPVKIEYFLVKEFNEKKNKRKYFETFAFEDKTVFLYYDIKTRLLIDLEAF